MLRGETTRSIEKLEDSLNYGLDKFYLNDENNDLDHYSQMEIILSDRGYQDINEIGKGGSGIVVSASKNKDNRVALKSTICNPYSSSLETPWEILNMEAKNLEFLHDKKVPNIVDFYGFESAFFDGFWGGFLELELCKDSAFDKEVYETSELVNHTLDIADSLYYMHEAGLVHGDIKPSNILMNYSGKVRLVDLATAREPRKFYESSPFSLGFLAPELMKTTIRSKSGDVFSLAATLYRALTGEDVREKSYESIMSPFEAPTAPRDLGVEISGGLEYAIMSGLEEHDRPNLGEFVELIEKSPESVN